MAPGGFFRRLFGHILNYIMRGMGQGQAEQHFEQTYGTVDDATFAQAYQEAEQSVENTARLFGLGLNQPISDVLQGAVPPAPIVGVRALITFADAHGALHYRTIDTDVDWSSTAGFVYAAVTGRARDIAGAYDWKVQDVQIVPPLLIPLVED